MSEHARSQHVNFKVGDWVEVRSQEEILATLDKSGRLENLPFMPEMLQYCGKRLRVFKRADKTCDYIQGWSIRRMTSTVHLEGARCDGSGHDGCEASCLIFWKEAWLKPVESDVAAAKSPLPADVVGAVSTPLCTVEDVLAASRTTNSEGKTIYSCHATDVPRFTTYMRMWDPRQYIRDLRSGNLRSGLAGDTREQRALELALGFVQVVRAFIISIFNEVLAKRRGRAYPFIQGAAEQSPIRRLDLQPGELVQVASKEEIMASLGKDQRNHGLWFDSEMLPYCGGIYRVLRPVHRIVEEKTGKMIKMKFPCVVLEGVVCKSDFHRLCPRAIYPYWRENWLKRVAAAAARDSCPEMTEAYKE